MTSFDRVRNPRGQGERLRADIVASALAIIDSSGSPDAVTLRAVARGAGVTAPSIYAHFADRFEIVAATVVEVLEELGRVVAGAVERYHDPVERLHAGCRAYLHFAAEQPQRYALAFGRPEAYRNAELVPDGRAGFLAVPGASSFTVLVDCIAACAQAGRSKSDDPFRDASAVWAGLHGYAGLTQGVALFPWPSSKVALELIVDRLAQIVASPE